MPHHNDPAVELTKDDLLIAGAALRDYIDAGDAVDHFLFRAFTPDKVAVLQNNVRNPDRMTRDDWDDLSLFLRSVALSLGPFPVLEKHYTQTQIYDAVDRIAEYALNLPGTPPARGQQGRGPRHEF